MITSILGTEKCELPSVKLKEVDGWITSVIVDDCAKEMSLATVEVSACIVEVFGVSEKFKFVTSPNCGIVLKKQIASGLVIIHLNESENYGYGLHCNFK